MRIKQASADAFGIKATHLPPHTLPPPCPLPFTPPPLSLSPANHTPSQPTLSPRSPRCRRPGSCGGPSARASSPCPRRPQARPSATPYHWPIRAPPCLSANPATAPAATRILRANPVARDFHGMKRLAVQLLQAKRVTGTFWSAWVAASTLGPGVREHRMRRAASLFWRTRTFPTSQPLAQSMGHFPAIAICRAMPLDDRHCIFSFLSWMKCVYGGGVLLYALYHVIMSAL
jgi:hypothetical protein